MEARTYLSQIGKLNSLIKNKLVEVEQWRDIAFSITAQMGGERVQSSGNQQKMATAIEKYVAIENEIDAHIDRLIDLRVEIIATIEQLEQKEYDLLHHMYVQMKPLKTAAADLNYSYSWAKETHREALAKVQKIIDNR